MNRQGIPQKVRLACVPLILITGMAVLALAPGQADPGDRSIVPEGTGGSAGHAWELSGRPSEQIREESLVKAWREIGRLRKQATSSSASLLPAESWVNIGPAPILPGGFSGRISDIAVDPSDANHWLLGAAYGGVWETLDAGASWIPRTDGEATQAIGAIVFAPSDPNIIYAGTGEASTLGYGGVGILKSLDGGVTWQLLATSTFARLSISGILVDPADPDVVVVSTVYGNAGRFGGRPTILRPPLGVFKSVDGGVTWTHLLTHESSDLEADPRDFRNLYAGLGWSFTGDPNTSAGVYRSSDAGDTWTRITGPWSSAPTAIGAVEIAAAPSNPDVLYVTIKDLTAVSSFRIWRTNNAWDPAPTWTQTDVPFDRNDAVIVDPVNPGILYVGGVRIYRLVGATFEILPFPPHVDIRAMVWAGNRLIAGNDGGIFSTTDGAQTWSNLNANLSITQFYDGSIDSSVNFAIGGTQDNGSLKWTGSRAWQEVTGVSNLAILGGDGSKTAISLTNPLRNWAVSNNAPGIWRTTDGKTVELVSNGIDPNDRLPFFHIRMELCPANSDVLVVLTLRRPFRSNDFFSAPAAPAWFPNGPVLGTTGALAFAESDPTCSTYVHARNSTGISFTVNGGASWTTTADTGGVLPVRRDLTDAALHPLDANILYVTYSSFDESAPETPGHVFKTTNLLSGSPAWVNVSPPVNVPFDTILVDRINPQHVYAGSDLGIWRSLDAGSSWTQMGPETGMPYVLVDDLQQSAVTGRIAAFTHGRGAYVLAPPGTCPTGPEHDSDVDGLGDGCDSCPLDAPQFALDADHNGCTDTLAGLTAIVGGLSLDPQFKNGLFSKLEEVQKALDHGNTNVAGRKLGDFIDQVEAKRGILISDADADLLVSYANNLITLITF